MTRPGAVGHAPFADLHPESDAQRRGAYATLGPFSGVLLEERGAPFAVAPTAYATPPGGAHRDGVGYLTREPVRRVHALVDGVVRGATGAVLDRTSGLAVRETLETWDDPVEAHPALREGEWGEPVRVPGVSLLLATLGGDGFYHFLTEALPRLHLARDVLAACDTVLVPGAGEQWRVAWLQRAGLDVRRVRWLDPTAHLVCDQLVFTGPLVRHFEPNPWQVRALRTLLGAEDAGEAAPGRRLWLDRSATVNRRKSWEGELHRLAAADCDPVDLGALGPGDVVRSCAQVTVFAGADKTQQEAVLSPAGDLDRIYYGVHQPLRLSEQRGAHLRQIQIDHQSFADTVVWNPGAAKCAALTDMPPEGYRRMLCIEAGCIEKPVLLSPGGRWSGGQTLTLL